MDTVSDLLHGWREVHIEDARSLDRNKVPEISLIK